MLVNWDAERIIWDRLFSANVMNVCRKFPASEAVRLIRNKINPVETSLLVTEPYFNLPNVAETYDQMVFEEWEFASYFRCTRMSLAHGPLR